MRLRKISERHLLPLHLLLTAFACARTAQVSEVTCEKVSFKETSLGDRYSDRETTIAAPITNSSQKLTSPIVETLPRNSSNVFRPSIHLGEIEQPKSRKNPFNNVQHVRFESNVHLDAQHERSQDVVQNAYQSVSGLLDEATRSSRIKFQDDVQVPSSIHHPFNDQQAVTEVVSGSPLEQATIGQVFLDQTFFQNVLKKPQDASTIFGKAMTDHRSTGGAYFDLSRSPPYVINYYASQNQNAHQPIQETTLEMIKKPESNGVLVVQQSTYTRKRKFPYTFYQPSDEYHDIQYLEEPHSTMTYPQMRSMSPWKKIIHLIGTILPLGLLLALTPKVVRINNNTTTQPSIVLSKLRVADLPIEHKRVRSLDEQSTAVCEDRSICELILAGSEPQSNILQNVLWNLATSGTADDVAKRNGLREIFSAVRKKDCATIDC